MTTKRQSRSWSERLRQAETFFQLHPEARHDPFVFYKIRHGIPLETPMNFDQWWEHECNRQAQRRRQQSKRYLPSPLFRFCRATDVRTWNELMTVSDHKVRVYLQASQTDPATIREITRWLVREQVVHFENLNPVKPGRGGRPARRR